MIGLVVRSISSRAPLFQTAVQLLALDHLPTSPERVRQAVDLRLGLVGPRRGRTGRGGVVPTASAVSRGGASSAYQRYDPMGEAMASKVKVTVSVDEGLVRALTGASRRSQGQLE